MTELCGKTMHELRALLDAREATSLEITASVLRRIEAVEEKVSLSDRFGLWLGFHNCSQDEYLDMIEGYAKHFGLKMKPGDLRAGAIAWQATRGSRSGRVAWQYIQDVAGRIGHKLAS